MAGSKPLGDDQILASFGYKQELRRALKLFSLYAVAFSIISITTGIFTNFGFGLAHLGPAFIWFWLLGFGGAGVHHQNFRCPCCRRYFFCRFRWLERHALHCVNCEVARGALGP